MTAKKSPPKPAVRVGQKNSPGAKRDPNSRTSKMVARRTEANLAPATRRRADAFVSQYLRDFNGTQAFIRMRLEEGAEYDEIDLNYAVNKGSEMKRWPYVAQKIQEALETAEEKNVVTRTEILYGLKREANYYGPSASHGARVGGWMGLARIMGMETKKIEASLALRGGVLVVPQTEDLEDWEQRAAAAQAALKEDVRK